MLSLRKLVLITLTLTACTHDRTVAGVTTDHSIQEIRYVSSDLDNAMVFSEGSARAGSIFAFSPGIWPSSPTRAIQTSDGVDCLSMGTPGNNVEFAIRRPIRAGDRYTCLRTSFHVTRCFGNCRAAVVEIEAPLGGAAPGTRKAYMYVDSCVGVLVFSQVADLDRSIPLDAAWLRGNVGILADSNYPECDAY